MTRERYSVESERISAIFDMIRVTDGKALPEDLIKAGRIAQKKISDKIGEKSERHFTDLARTFEFVASIRNSNPSDDVYCGIDKWITFTTDQKLPELPVQVKSSPNAVQYYKHGNSSNGNTPDPAFKKLRGLEIVVCCGGMISKIQLKHQLNREIKRIKIILESDSGTSN